MTPTLSTVSTLSTVYSVNTELFPFSTLPFPFPYSFPFPFPQVTGSMITVQFTRAEVLTVRYSSHVKALMIDDRQNGGVAQ